MAAIAAAMVVAALAVASSVPAWAAAHPTASVGADEQRRDPDSLTFTQIEAPDATQTPATAINARGQIVGLFTDATGVIHGFCGTVSQGRGRPMESPSPAGQTCDGELEAQ